MNISTAFGGEQVTRENLDCGTAEQIIMGFLFFFKLS